MASVCDLCHIKRLCEVNIFVFIMNFHFDSNTNYRDIALFFNAQFPYLRLYFFKQPHKNGTGSPKDTMIAHLGVACNAKKTCVYSVDENLTASDLEAWFQKEAGLYIQVFRKSGSAWLQTSVAGDSLTLKELNNKGREHEIAAEKPRDISEFREQP